MEESCVLWRPKVDVQCVQFVHVFALVHGVRRGKKPLRGILMRTRCLAAILAAETIYSKSEEARVLVGVLSPDCIQF
jgi:hypothetical protein